MPTNALCNCYMVRWWAFFIAVYGRINHRQHPGEFEGASAAYASLFILTFATKKMLNSKADKSINHSSPVITIAKNEIRFSKACHTRLDDCEYVELLYHPILQVIILRKSGHDSSTAIHWQNANDICNRFSSRAFAGAILDEMNWKQDCRYRQHGNRHICPASVRRKRLVRGHVLRGDGEPSVPQGGQPPSGDGSPYSNKREASSSGYSTDGNASLFRF